MEDEVLVNYKSEGVEELLIRIVVDVVKSQKEGTIKDYDITYTDGETDYISISKKKDTQKRVLLFGGLEEIRTPDPHNANVVRSQLRYKPVFITGLL